MQFLSNEWISLYICLYKINKLSMTTPNSGSFLRGNTQQNSVFILWHLWMYFIITFCPEKYVVDCSVWLSCLSSHSYNNVLLAHWCNNIYVGIFARTSCIGMLYTYILIYISWNYGIVRMAIGCGMRHKNTKDVDKYNIQTNKYSKYYKYFAYNKRTDITCWTMDNVQKTDSFTCNTSSSEPFRIEI
jgi:hypothetical protein